jgi:hypothetical protein
VNFAAQSTGVANVTASISQAGYTAANQQIQISIGPGSSGGVSILGYLPFVGVAIVLVLGGFIFLRRRRSKAKSPQPRVAEPEAEVEEEEEEEA